MRKSELKTAPDSEIILDLVQSYATACLNYNLDRGTKAIEKHLEDLRDEVLRRGMLTPEQVNKLK